ncbi:PREDICTED: protein FAM204A [Nanorana parkeri]|uniref:protein FAM204A n=1 Tax=Nanorana parkeri TaxID=125878 RepID=UPI0008543958|nr:PREDICTED: protein FAM204A [Nanorana parkeri]
MWSGLPSPGPSDSNSTEDEDDKTEPGSVSAAYRAKFLELQKKRSELEAEISRRQKRKRRKRGKSKARSPEAPEEDESSTVEKIPPLDTLQKYFGANEHLNPPVCQKVLKKSRLEQSLDTAVQKGDIEEAEEISDQLATRELAVKITKAASCHKYIKAKEEQESPQEGTKKQPKNLPWGFEAKKRWETKSNMGYM